MVNIKMKLKEPTKIGTLILMAILFIAIMQSNIQKGWAYDETLTTKNHNYPVYLILTMLLNNQTANGLKASTRIFNSTEGSWVTNYVLLNQIQKDLDILSSQVEGLKQATMYDYNDTYVPGCVYIFLSPMDLSLAGGVSNKVIEYIKSHTDIWWYVADVNFETLDLSIFGPPLKYLEVSLFSLTSVPKAQDALNPAFYEFSNGSYGLNPYAYSIVNNTIVPHYLQRAGINATLLFHNGTQWVFNEPFAKYLNHTFQALNSQYLFQKYNIVLNSTTSYSILESSLDFYHKMGWNTDPKINQNTTNNDIAKIIELGSGLPIYLNYLDYPNFRSFIGTYDQLFGDMWDEILEIFITTYVLFSHYWFCTAELTCYIASDEPDTGTATAGFHLFISLTINLTTLFVTASAVFTKKRAHLS